MGRVITTIALLVTAVCGRANAGSSGIETTYALTKTTYLSTESAQLKLTLVNRTAAEVAIAPTSVGFTTYGGAALRLRIMVCGRGCMWRFRVAPGARGVMTIGLPSCLVLSDGCMMEIGVSYVVTSAGLSETRTARLPPYRFVPDPDVTYKDVPDGQPVYVGIGSTDDAIAPDTVLLAVTSAPTGSPRPYDPTPYVAEVVKVLKDDGVVIDHTNAGLDDPGAWMPTSWSNYFPGSERRRPLSDSDDAATWRAQIYIKVVPDQSAAIARGVADLSRHFGARIGKVTERFVFNPSVEDPGAWNRALDDARSMLTRLVETVRGGKIGVYALSQMVTNLRFLPGWATFDGPYDTEELGSEGTVLLQPAAVEQPPEVKFAEEAAWVGTQSADFEPDPALAARAVSAFVEKDVPALGRIVTIAADQPELYAAGSASTAISLANWISPYFAALVHAHENAATFAKALGVTLGHESLYTMYSHPNDDTQSVGVATRFQETDRYPWQTGRLDPGVKVILWGDPRRQTIVPIGLQDEPSTIAEISEASPRWTAPLVRVAVELDSTAGTVPINPRIVLGRIKGLMRPVLAAFKTSRDGRRARYEVVVGWRDRMMVEGLIAALRRTYAAHNADMSTEVGAYTPDCAAVERRLLRAAFRSNWERARQDASSAHRTLHRLVLVAPMVESEGAKFCGPLASSTDWLPDVNTLNLPQNENTLPVATTSLMVFRTVPAAP